MCNTEIFKIIAKGNNSLKINDLENANKIFSNAIKNHPDSPELYQEIFLAYFNFNFLKEAVDIFLEANNNIKDISLENHMQILNALVQKNCYKEAVRVCKLVQERQDVNLDILKKLDLMLENSLVKLLYNWQLADALKLIKESFSNITSNEKNKNFGTADINGILYKYTLLTEALFAEALCKERGLKLQTPRFNGHIPNALQAILAILNFYDQYLYPNAKKLTEKELSFKNSTQQHSVNYVVGLVDTKPEVHVYENAYHPKNINALFNSKGYLIPSSMTWRHRWHPINKHQEFLFDVSYYSCENRNNCNVEDEAVLYLGGNFIAPKFNFGHVFLEYTSRLWFFVENDFNGKILLDIPPTESIPDYFLDLLKHLGWDYHPDKILFQDCEMIFSKIIIPELSHRWTAFHYTYNNELFNKISASMLNASPNKEIIEHNRSKKFYLSRKKSNKDVDGIRFGEDIIEKIFKDNGYSVIYCHEYSLIETSHLFHNAEIIVSPYQSGCYRLLLASCNNLRLAFFGYDIENCSFENIYLFFNYMRNFNKIDFFQVLHIDKKDWDVVKATNTFPEKPFIVPSYFNIQETIELLKNDDLIDENYYLPNVDSIQRQINDDFRQELTKFLPNDNRFESVI